MPEFRTLANHVATRARHSLPRENANRMENLGNYFHRATMTLQIGRPSDVTRNARVVSRKLEMMTSISDERLRVDARIHHFK